jgi:hypothetical protein
MGETGDTRFLPLLLKVLTDPSETTKAAAFRAIRKLRSQENTAVPRLNVRILGEPSLSDSILKVAFGISDSCHPVLKIAPTAIRILVNGELVYRYSITEQESTRRVSAGFLLPGAKHDRSETCRNALEQCFAHRRGGDPWLCCHHSEGSSAGATTRPETLFGVRIDVTETSGVRTLTSLADVRKACASRDTMRDPDFTTAFLKLCQDLRPSRVRGHLILLCPEGAQSIDPVRLAQAAQESHVSVHALCASHSAGVREICRVSGGFYMTGDDLAEMLAALYGGLTNRYQATLSPEVEVRRIQISVRSTAFDGDSPVVEMNHP